MAEFSCITVPFAKGHFVYRFWAGEECLYVGAVGATHRGAGSLLFRLGRHARESPWHAEADRLDFTVLSSAEEAKQEEITQIKSLNPRCNTVLNRCRKGLHDIRFPESRTSNGVCKECHNEFMTPYLRQWKKDHPDEVVQYQKTQREKVGDEEWKRRHNQWSAEWRARQKDKNLSEAA